MNIQLSRHYYFVDKGKVARKLFLCRQCNSKCTPDDFKPIIKNEVEVYLLASSYCCKKCDSKYIIRE